MTSLEAGPAKGVITRPDALHLCYCHSPMRYLWDQHHFYYTQSGLLGRLAMRLFAQPLRVWDAASATRVDAFAANSAFVSRRIAKAWGRKSEVIHPPVDAAAFRPDARVPAEEFYLYAGELNQYKRPEIAVEAFTRSGKPLIVIGDGGMRKKLEAIAGPNVTFLGKVPPKVLKDHFSRCRALVYPGIEDFGKVPLEVAAAGRPVLAFGQGGALETVIDGVTGLFFAEQNSDSLLGAVGRLEDRLDEFDSKVMMAHAATFTADRFRAQFSDFARRAQERLDLTGSEKL